jgi:molecular chaperone GrpE
VIENKEVGENPEILADEPTTDESEVAGNPGSGNLPLEIPTEAVRRLEDEFVELRDRHLRLAAEYDNFRKRAARERDELATRSQAALVVRLLEVLDDLDRLVSEGSSQSGDVIQEALVLIDRKLRKELEAAGLERVDPAGQPFDPTLHEAVAVLPAPEAAQDHVVAATFQIGYRFKGSLIRPARVQVFSAEGHL